MSQSPEDLPPPSQEQEAGEALPLVELDTLLNRPPSQRKRLIQLSLMLVALLVVVLTFLNVARSPLPPRSPGHHQPTLPPPTLSILSNVNYGTLTINGQPQPRSSSRALQMHSQPPYTITLEAPPFRPLSCPFPPPSPRAPYGFMPCVASGGFTSDQQPMATLQMLFTLEDLPPAQQQQIGVLIPQAIRAQQTITVPAQSSIVTGLTSDGLLASKRFPGPLEASAFLVPSQQGETSCPNFICTQGGTFVLNDSLSGQFWEVTTPVALRWRFTDMSGQVISEVTFPPATLLPLYLSYGAATGWQVGLLSAAQLSQDLTQLVCPTGVDLLGREAQQFNDHVAWEVTTLHDQGLAGCELSLQGNMADQGHFIWRFGALLAADAQAHSTLPLLPMASPAELAAVEG